MSILIKVFEYTGSDCFLFICSAGVNNTIADYTSIFSPVKVPLFVVVSMEIFSLRRVKADRTWPVLLCRCQRSHSAQSLDRR